MEPIFTMQYGEFAVADYLSKNIKDASIYIPASAQEKGIDLLLYRFEKDKNTTNTIQVKMSRTYYNEKCRKGFPYNLWFNRFHIHDNANWFVLVGIFAKRPKDANARAKSTAWDTVMLAFKKNEMKEFMDEVKQKKDPTKPDLMFGFGFDDDKRVFQTRGYRERRDMSRYLISNRLNEIQNSFT